MSAAASAYWRLSPCEMKPLAALVAEYRRLLGQPCRDPGAAPAEFGKDDRLISAHQAALLGEACKRLLAADSDYVNKRCADPPRGAHYERGRNYSNTAQPVEDAAEGLWRAGAGVLAACACVLHIAHDTALALGLDEVKEATGGSAAADSAAADADGSSQPHRLDYLRAVIDAQTRFAAAGGAAAAHRALVDIAAALSDYAQAAGFGADALDVAARLVHRSNMSKLCPSLASAEATAALYKRKAAGRQVTIRELGSVGGARRFGVFAVPGGELIRNMRWSPPDLRELV